MALITTQGRVKPQQGKTIILMQFCDIIHQPIIGRVATSTIRTGGLPVDVRMAGNTLRGRSLEN